MTLSTITNKKQLIARTPIGSSEVNVEKYNELVNDHNTALDRITTLENAPSGTPERTANTGNTVSFITEEVYNTAGSPTTGNIVVLQTNAKLGIVQKLYHNHTAAPTYSSTDGVTDIQQVGDAVYVPNELNIIFLEWCSENRVEYWYVQEY